MYQLWLGPVSMVVYHCVAGFLAYQTPANPSNNTVSYIVLCDLEFHLNIDDVEYLIWVWTIGIPFPLLHDALLIIMVRSSEHGSIPLCCGFLGISDPWPSNNTVNYIVLCDLELQLNIDEVKSHIWVWTIGIPFPLLHDGLLIILVLNLHHFIFVPVPSQLSVNCNLL